MALLNIEFLIYFLVLPVLMLLYFKIADKFNIVDKPNHRSSHEKNTIRGGGVIFPIAILLDALSNGIEFHFFILGLFIISFVSFFDDLKPLSSKIRLLIHLAAVSLMFWENGLNDLPLLVVVFSYIIAIGTINAYNFMDGINGITGSYSLAALATLFYINQVHIEFVPSNLIIAPIIAILVFNYFNFRKTAKCFAGDVGSVSMAFVLIFFLSLLMIETGELKYIGLLLIYGLDSITTIIFRTLRKENIFEAHRSHFYQYLANNLNWSHLHISTIYFCSQIAINILLIKLKLEGITLILFFLISGLIFIWMRFRVEGKEYLLGRANINQTGN